MVEFFECRMGRFWLVKIPARLAIIYFMLFNNAVTFSESFVEHNHMSDQEIV
jgi:hypothetical protein